MVTSAWKKLVQWISKYPIVFSVLGIYGYYLFTTLDFFKKSEVTHLTLIDFIFQYESLIWMWLVVYVVSRSQSLKQKYESAASNKTNMVTEVEKSAIASAVLRSVIHLLQDTINNPLAIIANTAEEVRRQVPSDSHLNRQFDLIESSLQRIHNAIKDVEVYESTQLL